VTGIAPRAAISVLTALRKEGKIEHVNCGGQAGQHWRLVEDE
jgi:hypothetical protein